jgi:hypothetical protein
LYALTVTQGDPSWAGALAGVALGLPVYHITEPEIAAQIPPDIYAREVGVAALVLDTQAIAAVVRDIREQYSVASA